MTSLSSSSSAVSSLDIEPEGAYQQMLRSMPRLTISPLFADETRRTRLLGWSQFTLDENNVACAPIACNIALSLLLSSPGSVVSYVPAARGGGAFTVNESQLLRCTREATDWWKEYIKRRVVGTTRHTQSDDARKAELRAAASNYLMPLEWIKERPELSSALHYEERWGIFDARVGDVGADNSAVGESFTLTSIGSLLSELSQRAPPLACVLTRSNSTSCVFVERTTHERFRNYWFIDTHCNNASGERVSDGRAIVMRFGSLVDLSLYIEELYSGGASNIPVRPLLSASALDSEYVLKALYGKANHTKGEQAAAPNTQFEAVILTPRPRRTGVASALANDTVQPALQQPQSLKALFEHKKMD